MALKGNRLILIASIEICLYVLLNGQEGRLDIPVVSTGDIQYYVDHSAFRGQNRNTRFEVYIMTFADQLEYRVVNGQETADISTQIILEKTDGTGVVNKSWTTHTYLLEDNIERQFKAVYDQWYYSMDPGWYDLQITVTDLTSLKTGTADITLNIPDISQNSQFQFVSSIESGEPDHPFYKAGKVVYPQPSRRYGIMNPNLFINYELYGLNIDSVDSLTIQYSITDGNDNIAKKYPRKIIPLNYPDISISHGLGVRDLGSGNYELVADIVSVPGSEKIRITRTFEIIQKDYLTNAAVLSAEQLNLQEGLLKILATPMQYKRYSNLSSNAKPRYLIDFWREKDPAPNTPENEYLIETIKRYRYANTQYSWGKDQGWSTDRGRILIKYGYPDEISRYDYEEYLNPHVVWQFHDIKNYIFIFGDVQGNGRYRLLHSNAEQEIQDLNWRKRLIKTL